jgi:hypothetical protein
MRINLDIVPYILAIIITVLFAYIDYILFVKVKEDIILLNDRGVLEYEIEVCQD